MSDETNTLKKLAKLENISLPPNIKDYQIRSLIIQERLSNLKKPIVIMSSSSAYPNQTGKIKYIIEENNNSKIKLVLVDDDAVFLNSLKIQFLNEADFDIETYNTGELCLENLDKNPDVIILDYHLDGVTKNAMNGLKTLDTIKKTKPEIPIIILSLIS